MTTATGGGFLRCIKKIIVDLLDDKYPVLSIGVDESNKDMAGLSILDEETGFKFKLPDQGISQPLLNFKDRKTH